MRVHLSIGRRRAILLGSICILLGLALGAVSTSAAPTVTVRVEGESATLLPATPVTLSQPEPVSGCAADSAAAAINLAVGGNWDHGEANHGAGDFTETLLGETHAFLHESDTWTEWVNYKLGGGICTDLLSEGEEVLMVADHTPEPTYAPTVLPLVVGSAPRVAAAGVPFQVQVNAVRIPAGTEAAPGAGEQVPAEGATVSGAGTSAQTGAGGVASISLAGAGTYTLRATKAGDAPSATFTVCVHSGNDGTCGTPAPSGGAPLAPSPPVLDPYTGPFALVAHLAGVLDGHAYARTRAPRLLSGTILAHSAVDSVALSLRRSYRGRCYAYDGIRERFLGARCGQESYFAVSSGGVFSYLLPAALPPGRYVLDVRARDAAGNSLTLARGTSRIVFRVR
jgi:hypothetical protein